jgi:hypothetical protein
VQVEVAEEQKEQNDPTILQGFLDLGRQFDNGITANRSKNAHIYRRSPPRLVARHRIRSVDASMVE